MYLNRRIVIVTPAGRQKYMEILLKYVVVLHNIGIVDEYQIWENTQNESDKQYLANIAASHKFIRHIKPSTGIDGNFSIAHFFPNAQDDKTVYVRFDDDIVFVEVWTFIHFLHFRIKHPEYFLCFANVINNAMISHIHQRLGVYQDLPHIGYNPMDRNGWRVGDVANAIHERFFEKQTADHLNDYRFPQWILNEYDRVSINCISWLGEEFKQFGGEVDRDEEPWLTQVKPKLLNKPSCIYGGFVVCHFAFYIQRKRLIGAKREQRLLERYMEIADHEARLGSDFVPHLSKPSPPSDHQV